MHHHRMPSLPDCSVTRTAFPCSGILLRKYSDEIVQDSDLLPFYLLHLPKSISSTVCIFDFVHEQSYYSAKDTELQVSGIFSARFYSFLSAR